MSKNKDLEVWKKSMKLVKEVYDALKEYPKEELFALTQQTRRAVVSVAANIAEGVGRGNKKETIHFLNIAHGSTYGVDTLIAIAAMNNLIDHDRLARIQFNITEVLRLLDGFINYYENARFKLSCSTCQLPTNNCQLLPANCQPPTANYSLANYCPATL